MDRRPLRGHLCIEVLWNVLCGWKSFESSYVDITPLEDLLWIEVLGRSYVYRNPLKGHLWIEVLWKILGG